LEKEEEEEEEEEEKYNNIDFWNALTVKIDS
jgi:hypothetical protein